jgi:hypothetical protein
MANYWHRQSAHASNVPLLICLPATLRLATANDRSLPTCLYPANNFSLALMCENYRPPDLQSVPGPRNVLRSIRGIGDKRPTSYFARKRRHAPSFMRRIREVEAIQQDTEPGLKFSRLRNRISLAKHHIQHKTVACFFHLGNVGKPLNAESLLPAEPSRHNSGKRSASYSETVRPGPSDRCAQ